MHNNLAERPLHPRGASNSCMTTAADATAVL